GRTHQPYSVTREQNSVSSIQNPESRITRTRGKNKRAECWSAVEDPATAGEYWERQNSEARIQNPE
ncbi:MAG TPA: hypothetical protein PLU81_08585, partial [Deltaproteobacteria bacterium]|nr:hypothetical protein [Deltaproteobacteria bacterium]